MAISLKNKRVLITGGSHGLGKALVQALLKKGCKVVTTGKNEAHFGDENCSYYQCDFSRLSNISEIIFHFKRMKFKFDLVINNAGILSPPSYQSTPDGYEASFQINFLSHVFLYKELMRGGLLSNALIVNISSPLYRKGSITMNGTLNEHNYNLFKAYSNSKLYMALFSERIFKQGTSSFSFDPGTFSSGIYRLQRKWFRLMYKVAAPAMTSPETVARKLLKVIENRTAFYGSIINKRGRIHNMNIYNDIQKANFWKYVDKQLQEYSEKHAAEMQSEN